MECDSPVFYTFSSIFAVVVTASLAAILIEIEKMNRFLRYSVWMGIEPEAEAEAEEAEEETEDQAHEE
jgi:hypothetical protein